MATSMRWSPLGRRIETIDANCMTKKDETFRDIQIISDSVQIQILSDVLTHLIVFFLVIVVCSGLLTVSLCRMLYLFYFDQL